MSIGKNNTELFYREIMQRVCESVKEDFLNEGVGEDVIGELKRVSQLVYSLAMDRKISSEWNFSA